MAKAQPANGGEKGTATRKRESPKESKYTRGDDDAPSRKIEKASLRSPKKQQKKKHWSQKNSGTKTEELARKIEDLFDAKIPILETSIPSIRAIRPEVHIYQKTERRTESESRRKIRFGTSPTVTSKNLEQSSEGRDQSEVDKALRLEPAALNKTLCQAGNFLSRRDVERHVDFVDRLDKIDRFLKQLTDDKLEYHAGVFEKVKQMVEVHQSRMNQRKAPTVKPIKSNEAPTVKPVKSSEAPSQTFLSSLAKQSMSRSGQLRDDHPPFTLERPADQNLFLKAIHEPSQHAEKGVKDRRRELLNLEDRAFSEALKTPSLIHQLLEESDSQPQDEKFGSRATKRGHQRAAVRMALRSFATNSEQHYQGRWEQSQLRLPAAPVPVTADQGIIPNGNETTPQDFQKPFFWTEKYAKYRSQVNDGTKAHTPRSLQDLARPLNGNKYIVTEEEAAKLLNAEILKEQVENKHQIEAVNATAWNPPIPVTATPTQYFSHQRSAQTGMDTRPDIYSAQPKEENQDVMQEIDYEIKPGDMFPEEIKHFDSQRARPRLENARDPRETFYPGQSVFTFAETPFLQAMISGRIDRDLAQGKRQDRAGKKNIAAFPHVGFSLPAPEAAQKAALFDPGRGEIQFLRRKFLNQTELRKNHPQPTAPAKKDTSKTYKNQSTTKIFKPYKENFSPYQNPHNTRSQVPRNQTIGAHFSQKAKKGWPLHVDMKDAFVPNGKKGKGKEGAQDVDMADASPVKRKGRSGWRGGSGGRGRGTNHRS